MPGCLYVVFYVTHAAITYTFHSYPFALSFLTRLISIIYIRFNDVTRVDKTRSVFHIIIPWIVARR